MLEFMIAWGIIAFMLFFILGGVGAICKSSGDDRLASLLALGAMVSLVWPIALVVGLCYVLLWTGTQGSKALWNLKESKKDDSIQDR